MDSPRQIIHLDLDAFFAAVEVLDNPSLKGKPVIVGGSPKSRGVVCTASYEARKFGVRSAMPCSKAYKLCPEGIFTKTRFSRYREISQKIFAYYYGVTDLVETLSMDEAFLDETKNNIGMLYAEDIAIFLRKKVESEIGITVSAGVAPNKFLAKLASEENKPNGHFVIKEKDKLDYLEGLPLKKYWGVGPATLVKLNKNGFYRTHDIRKSDEVELSKLFGKFGPVLYQMAFGEDIREVQSKRVRKSIGVENTFSEDLYTLEEVKNELEKISNELVRRLEKKKKNGRTITLKVKDNQFKVRNKSRTFDLEPIKNENIYESSLRLFLSLNWDMKKNIRLLGVSVSNFEELISKEQPPLPFIQEENSCR
jgi:DNA polymerase-4